MPYVIHENPSLDWDAQAMLARVYERDTIGKWADKLIAEYGERIDASALRAITDGPAALMDEVAAAVDLSDERAARLFKEREKINQLAAVVFCQKNLHDAGKGDLRYAFALSVHKWSDGADEDVPADDAAMLRWAEGLDADAEDKYDILRLYFDFHAYADYHARKIAETAQILQAGVPRLRAQIDDSVRQLAEQVRAHGTLLPKGHVGVDIDDGEVYDIYPSVAMVNGLMMHCETRIPVNRIHVGVSLYRVIELIDDAKAKQQIPGEWLKALADPTKMSILLALRERKHYSAELAAALELTGATISHHMATLTSLGAATVQKAGNRVYYELNHGALREKLRALEAVLCGDEAKSKED